MYFITTKRMLEVCFSAHPNIQYRTYKIKRGQGDRSSFIDFYDFMMFATI